MDKFVKEFVDYLMYIGLINSNSISLFISAFNANVDKSDNQQDNNALPLLSSSLLHYLSHLSSDNKKQIATSLISKFIENKSKLCLSALKSIVMIKERKTKQLCMTKWSIITSVIFSQSDIPQREYQAVQSEKTYLSPSDNFILRQQNFSKQHQKQHEKRLLQSEDEFSIICPFSPTLMTSNYFKGTDGGAYSKGKTAYVRLYNDSRRRTEANSRRQYDLSNKSGSNVLKITKTSKKNNADETMYNYYKIYKNKKLVLQKNIDLERGITFKPELKSPCCNFSDDKLVNSH